MSRGSRVSSRRLTSQSVALVVKRRAQAVGLDPQRFGGHSLRSGLAPSAAMAGVAEHDIMRQTGHRSTTMVRRYVRHASLFQANAAAAVL